MYYAVISIISIISESLFISGLFYKLKGFNNKFGKLFTIVLVCYLFCGIITSFSYSLQVWFYLIFNIFVIIGAKILYKSEIIILDFLIFGYIGFILTFINIAAGFFEAKFGLIILFSFLIGRMFMLLFYLVFKKYSKAVYYRYYNFWHRRDDGLIKSITIRNISLIILNIFIYILNILINYAVIERW